MRTCFRCGATFETDNGRVCEHCARPYARRSQRKRNLTFREMQVVALVAQGKANKQVAHELLLTEGTVKEYLNRIGHKLRAEGADISNRTELAIWFLKQQQTEPKPI